ncbi:MAG: thiamine pyrophosphate-dependent dehydrogenase E1 component subunit alpha [Chloroflexi bacterium]|nr:thiamine pyrophosphate-dependent dehydrogenase E1 component subunit alpha [Chloroflexota bacterium]
MADLTKEELLGMYRQMHRIRAFEMAVYDGVQRGVIAGGPHLYVGEEAVAVGVCTTLRPMDYITSTHRGHGHLIAKGGQLKPMMAEILGKATGYCKGKGGSMHIADLNLGILGANGIVGGGLPTAVGAALSSKLKQGGWVVASFFGDGAANTGSFHESLNLAAAWKLPVIFVCENNTFAMFTPMEWTTAIKDLSARAAAYGMVGTTVDGNDVLAVYRAAVEARERALAGEGPTLLECKTYRFLGHYVGDPEDYRKPGEVEMHKKNDPLPRFEKVLIEAGMINKELMQQMMAETRQEAKEALEFALSSPDPDPSELTMDVRRPFKPLGDLERVSYIVEEGVG